jgi:hypothetical protein
MIWLSGAFTASVLAAAVIAIGTYALYLKKKKPQEFAMLKAGYQVDFAARAKLSLVESHLRPTDGGHILGCTVKDSRYG